MRPLRTCLLLFAAGAVSFGSGCTATRTAGSIVREHTAIALGAAALTHVRLRMDTGELRVRGGAGTLLEADFAYNVPGWKPSIVHTSGAQGELAITQGSSAVSFSRTENRWELALNDTVPLDIETHLGAGEAHLTLGSLNLRGLDVSVGAGEADVDLRGTPAASYTASIHGGVGQATVHLPTSVAIAATASGGIGDIQVSGLEQRDGRWVNPRALTSPITITLDVHGGVGQIQIEAD